MLIEKNLNREIDTKENEKIKPVDPTLLLYEESPNKNYINTNIVTTTGLNAKQKLSIELLQIILKDPSLFEDEREKILQLIENIKSNELDYFYVYSDITGINDNVVSVIKTNKGSIEEPSVNVIQNTLDFDVEFYKIGRKCSGLKKRYAIIRDGKLYSSDKPLSELEKYDEKEWEKMKQKTQFLEGAEVINESFDQYDKGMGEWSNKEKKFRIRINYIADKEKNTQSSFFFYFDNERQMKTVESAIFNLIKSDNYKLVSKNNLDNLKHILEASHKFYTILKILAVKNKIKSRKRVFKKVENSTKYRFIAQLKPEFFEQKISVKVDINIDFGSLSKKSSNLFGKKIIKEESRKESIKSNFFNINFIDSDYLPLISKVSFNNDKLKNKKYLRDLKNKYMDLSNIIPPNIFNDNGLTEDAVCLEISNGVQFVDNTNNNDMFNLKDGFCDNIKYIYFDKINNEIIFKTDNDDNDNMNQNKLNANNINEISSVIKNSNLNLNEDECSIVLFGPKLDNDTEINYSYKDIEHTYSDPEAFNIKNKIYNELNNKEIEGVTLQIYQLEFDINNPNIIPLESDMNLNDDILLGYTIKLSETKYIESLYKEKKDFKDGVYFFEFNHQYFIPKEFFEANENNEITIEYYCISKSSFDDEKDQYSKKELSYLSKYLSPVSLGKSVISLNDIITGKYKYDIINNNNVLDNCFIVIDGMKETIKGININNYIRGKDYTIGNDSYIIKEINKDFIETAMNSNYLTQELKEKYFNVNFDTENNRDILLRPNENMDESSFLLEISNQISNENILKIKENKQFNYLPFCEKYIDKDTLIKSGNFSEEQINYITENYNEGDWIYKLPSATVKLLSKNLGVLKDTNQISQRLYCTGEEVLYSLESLDGYKDKKVIPISENNFNSFDFKDLNYLDNFDSQKYQWVTSIKFNNQSQMESFIKLLKLSRQNITTKKRNEKEVISVDEKKFEEFNGKKNKGNNKKPNKCKINIKRMEFTDDLKIEGEQLTFDAKIIIDGLKEKSIIFLFIDHKYGFRNSITENGEIQNLLQQYPDGQEGDGSKIIKYPQISFDKNKFNDGNKKIINYNKTKEIDFDRNQINTAKYTLNINLNNAQFFIPLDIYEILNNTSCEEIELPLRKEGEKRICSRLELQLEENEGSYKPSFKEAFEIENSRYLKEPMLIFDENLEFPAKKNHLGICEPNVFRRKILNLIHNKNNINIDPSNLNNYDAKDLEELYKILKHKCVILPDFSEFSEFKFYNLRRNNGKYNLNHSYRKKLGFGLLKIKKHEKFMKIFRENEWKIYLDEWIQILKELNENNNYEINNPEDALEYIAKIPGKKYLLKNKKFGDKLRNLIYMGIPSPEYREVFYINLLDLPEYYKKTKDIIYDNSGEDLQNPKEIFSFFVNQLNNNNNHEKNIIFSLIDNDSDFLREIENSTLDEIKTIKKIVKSFFIWAEYKIGFNDPNDKYIYFKGFLSLAQQLYQYFKKEDIVFWILIGLAQNIAHFRQKNPLFSDDLNYINIYGLVTKLIMERHQKKIFDKFLSLNIPPELFISSHLSTLFTDYFKGELMMRILDIIIFESSYQDIYSDKMEYLRILCSIPLTLFELNESEILACKSVSEIESILTNNLFMHTFDKNAFISTLSKNINKYYVVTGFMEKWFFNNQGREWDSKRGVLEQLIKSHFSPIYEENKNYLKEIYYTLDSNSKDFIELYFDNLDNKFNSIKPLFFQGTADDDESEIGIIIQISKLKQIFNNINNNINEYIIDISFCDVLNRIEQKYGNASFDINFDSQNNELMNSQDLYNEFKFKNNQFPKYIYFNLLDKNNIHIASFSYNIINQEFMKISKIILENIQENNKFFLEFILMKYTTKTVSLDELILFNNIFSPPEYFNSIKIEEKLYSYSISGYFFNKEISKLIKNQNDIKNKMIQGNQYDQSMNEQFKIFNLNNENEDKYNPERIINKKSDIFNEKISQKIITIIERCLSESTSKVVKKWLGDTNISLEEILYSIILVDKSIITINEKLYLLFSIAQMKDKLLLNIDNISVDKVKEMIYSLYKRFRIFYTKSDIERMVDYLLKDETLFNIKYAFVHKKDDFEKINEIIYDKDYYEPKIDGSKKDFEIIFDDITKELNIFLNHLNNHYNLTTFSPQIITYIFTSILNNKKITKYTSNKLNAITLVIEKDNIIYKRNYYIEYSPLKITEYEISSIYLRPKNENDSSNCGLCNEVTNIDIKNSYSEKKYITFDKFKEVFFKLPYLSDLIRVSLSYLNGNNSPSNKQFDNFKIKVGFENNTLGIFYYPARNIGEDENNEIGDNVIKHDMNYKVKITDTVDKLIDDIKKEVLGLNIINNNQEKIIVNSLNAFDKIKCNIFYYISEENKGSKGILMEENIGYFDSLDSCMNLKNKNTAEIHITFDDDIMFINSSMNIVEKEDGYCKIYYSTNNEFAWKKCKVKKKDMSDVKLTSADYKTSPKVLNLDEDIMLAHDI